MPKQDLGQGEHEYLLKFHTLVPLLPHPSPGLEPKHSAGPGPQLTKAWPIPPVYPDSLEEDTQMNQWILLVSQSVD